MNRDDGEFYSVVAEAEALIEDGATVFQRFTCVACQTRQTMPDPNRFYTSGLCDECKFVTDIVQNGCGFMLVMGTDPEMQEEFIKGLSESIANSKPRNRN